MNKDELRRPDGQTVYQQAPFALRILRGAGEFAKVPEMLIPTIGLGYLGYKNRGTVGALVGAFLGFVIGFGYALQQDLKD